MPMHDNASEALHAAIAALESHRAALGDALVDAALGPLLERRALLNAEPLSPQPARRLRQVSVLFLDIVGSTQLIQELEPEDVQEVVRWRLSPRSCFSMAARCCATPATT
jgi:class 3 adenylate cyclase